MPDVTISDDLSDTGTINVYPEGSIVRVTGTHIGIDVLTETSQVRVFGESYFFRIKIRWNEIGRASCRERVCLYV